MDQIKSEVRVVVDSILVSFGRLDGTAALQYWWDSPEFIAYNIDGSRADFQANKKTTMDFVNSASTFKLATIREDFPVVTKDLVICAWVGKQEASLKSGDKLRWDPDATTFVFRKIAGQWKAIYTHESAMFTTQKVGKK